MKASSALFLVAALLAGWVGSGLAGRPAGSRCRGGVLRPVGTRSASYAATLVRAGRVYRDHGRGPLVRLRRRDADGYPTTLSIVGAIVDRSCRAAWDRVAVPICPNGTTG